MIRTTDFALAAFVLASALLAACGGGSPTVSGAPPSNQSSQPPPTTPPSPPAGIQSIKHIVIVVQENRSFDYLFHGFPGANTVSSGKGHLGQMIPLQQESLAQGYDLAHQLTNFLLAYDDGKDDGFDIEGKMQGITTQPYGYAPQNQVQPYFDLASKYALADNMFASQIDSSFTAHQYLVAAQTANAVDSPESVPWGCDGGNHVTVPTLLSGRREGPNIPACFNYQTIANELDAAGDSWAYYAPKFNDGSGDLAGALWTAFDADRAVRYTSDWTTNMRSPETSFLSDAAAGNLPAVSWVIPDLANSDHTGNNSTSGPQWVASVVNAAGTGPDWPSTAIFIVWDDWGGWFDHVSPPQLDLHGLGFRVPMIVVSPYAKTGFISHTRYEFGSILQFVEARFGLLTLAASDARAKAPYDCFDFSQQPRPYTAIHTHLSPLDFLNERPSLKPPDDD